MTEILRPIGKPRFCVWCDADMMPDNGDWIVDQNLEDVCIDCTEGMVTDTLGGMLNAFNVLMGNEDPADADADALEFVRVRLEAWKTNVLLPAVDGIIEVHKATGIDLKNWPPVLKMVQSVRPEFSTEGEPDW